MRNRFGLIGLGSLMAVAAWAGVAGAAGVKGTPGDADRKFAQLETVLPTPGETRSASGAPGARYWQQRADYRIKVSLDESKHRLTGSAVISYTNRSPDTLTYIWLQLDQNTFKDGSVSRLTETTQTTGARGGAVLGRERCGGSGGVRAAQPGAQRGQ
jgi:hypothetical protein